MQFEHPHILAHISMALISCTNKREDDMDEESFQQNKTFHFPWNKFELVMKHEHQQKKKL